jgi:hypothetical protein
MKYIINFLVAVHLFFVKLYWLVRYGQPKRGCKHCHERMVLAWNVLHKHYVRCHCLGYDRQRKEMLRAAQKTA